MKSFFVCLFLFIAFIGFFVNWILMVIALGFAVIIGCLPSSKKESRKTIIRNKDDLDKWYRSRALEWKKEKNQ